MSQYKKLYDSLYEDVLQALREVVKNSKQISKHCEALSIPIREYRYREVVIIDNKLILLDEDGYQYNSHFLRLENFVEILENYTNFCYCKTIKVLISRGDTELVYSTLEGQQHSYKVKYGLFKILIDGKWWVADQKLFTF